MTGLIFKIGTAYKNGAGRRRHRPEIRNAAPLPTPVTNVPIGVILRGAVLCQRICSSSQRCGKRSVADQRSQTVLGGLHRERLEVSVETTELRTRALATSAILAACFFPCHRLHFE